VHGHRLTPIFNVFFPSSTVSYTVLEGVISLGAPARVAGRFGGGWRRESFDSPFLVCVLSHLRARAWVLQPHTPYFYTLFINSD
jgi:hypothetical protein